MNKATKQRLTKRRLALIQIERSVQLLQDYNDPISALTLAAAAEEILGRIVSRKGKTPLVEDLADYLGTIYDWAGIKRPSKNQLISSHNKIRNKLKHNDGGKNSYVDADFQFEAEAMIVRAIKNYFLAFKCFPGNKRVREWFEFTCL